MNEIIKGRDQNYRYAGLDWTQGRRMILEKARDPGEVWRMECQIIRVSWSIATEKSLAGG